jgi:hypothetical protein
MKTVESNLNGINQLVKTRYKTVTVNGIKIFYSEAG